MRAVSMQSWVVAGLAVFAIGVFAALAAPTAGGQSEGDQGQAMKVGVVDLATVFKSYKRSAQLEKRINDERDKLKTKLDVQKEAIKEINKAMDLLDYASEAYKLREEEKTIELARFDLMKRRLERTIKQRWEEYNLLLLEDIEEVVKAYGEEHTFTLILKVEGKPVEEQKLLIGLKNVMYFAKDIDITADVVSILNREFGVGGGSDGN